MLTILSSVLAYNGCASESVCEREITLLFPVCPSRKYFPMIEGHICSRDGSFESNDSSCCLRMLMSLSSGSQVFSGCKQRSTVKSRPPVSPSRPLRWLSLLDDNTTLPCGEAAKTRMMPCMATEDLNPFVFIFSDVHGCCGNKFVVHCFAGSLASWLYDSEYSYHTKKWSR